MRGANPVPEYLESIAGILENDRDFTERDPVYAIDPEASLFSVEHPASTLPIPEVKIPERPAIRNVKGASERARYVADRTVGLRVNPSISRVNEFANLALEAMRRIATAERKLEEQVRRVTAAETESLRSLESRIEALEAEVSELKRQERPTTPEETA